MQPLEIGARVRVVRHVTTHDARYTDAARAARARYMPLLAGTDLYLVSISDAHGLMYYVSRHRSFAVATKRTGDGWMNPVRERADVYAVEPEEVVALDAPAASDARRVRLLRSDGSVVRETTILCAGVDLPRVVEWDDGPDGSALFLLVPPSLRDPLSVEAEYVETPSYLLSLGEVRS